VKIFFVSVVAAPEGVSYIQQNCKHSYEIWTGDLDDKLNEMAYIVPGLGDAGDLSFGKKI
jgi:uracil phosphoribosyltransferase